MKNFNNFEDFAQIFKMILGWVVMLNVALLVILFLVFLVIWLIA